MIPRASPRSPSKLSLYRTRFLGLRKRIPDSAACPIVAPDAPVRSRHRSGSQEGRPGGRKRLMADVASDEVAHDPSGFGEILEPMKIEAPLFAHAHEALDDAVALGFADVGRRDRHPEPLGLVDPGIGDVLRPQSQRIPNPNSRATSSVRR